MPIDHSYLLPAAIRDRRHHHDDFDTHPNSARPFRHQALRHAGMLSHPVCALAAALDCLSCVHTSSSTCYVCLVRPRLGARRCVVPIMRDGCGLFRSVRGRALVAHGLAHAPARALSHRMAMGHGSLVSGSPRSSASPRSSLVAESDSALGTAPVRARALRTSLVAYCKP